MHVMMVDIVSSSHARSLYQCHASPAGAISIAHSATAILLLFVVVLLPNEYSRDVRLDRLAVTTVPRPKQAAANATLGGFLLVENVLSLR